MNFITVIWLSLSIFLTFIIVIRTPNNDGLVTLMSTNDFLSGSASSTEKLLNRLTWFLILLDMTFAFILNNK